MTEITSALSETASADVDKGGFDIDKRAEISQNREASADKGFDIDKRAEVKTDDHGKSYIGDGELKPNCEYTLNDNTYCTDDLGRIVHCDGSPQISPENTRDKQAQLDAGGVDRKPGDQGGHIIGRDLNGNGGKGNIVAMDERINTSDYKRMENQVKNCLNSGKVNTETTVKYSGESQRPDRIDVTVTANDGKRSVFKFDNNLDNSLMSEVPENGKVVVQDSLDAHGGNISSIREDYNADGKLEKTTVSTTYTDETGKPQRDHIVIQGGI